MRIDAGQLERVLDTFADYDFAHAVASAKRLARTDGAVISKNGRAVPTTELRQIYTRRASNPRLREALARECERLAQIAGQFPSEGWYIYIVVIGDGPQVTIFANEDGIGRACLDYTA